MRWHLKPWPALIISSPALITPLPVNRFPNKVAPKVPINILRNPPFCSFASFLIISLTYFINKHYSLRDLTTIMISFISSLEIINGVVPDLNIFLWIAASGTDADRVNPNGIKTLLANGLNSCSIKCYPVFSNGPKSLPNNPPDCPILCNSVFHNFFISWWIIFKSFAKPQKLCIL